MRRNSVIYAFLLILVLAVFVTAVMPAIYQNTASSAWDQRDYLKIALWMSQGDGITDGNRSPLYPLFLAPFASREIAFFTTAKLVSLGIGLAGLGIIFAVSRRIVGGLGALLVIILFMANVEYRQAAAFVDVEVLLVPLFLLAWYTGYQAIDRIVSGTSDALTWSIFAGLFAGLTYLAKGTGMLLVLLFAAVLLLILGLDMLRKRGFWTFILTFALVSLPLWIYNAVRFGNPLFNVNTQHYIWLDSWEESYVYPSDSLPTAVSYLETHSLAEMAERLWNGLTLVTPKQWYGAARLTGLPESGLLVWGTAVLGLLVLLLIGYQVSRTWPDKRIPFLYTLLGLVMFIILFAWYHPISNAARFVLPWIPVIFISVVWWLGKYWRGKERPYLLITFSILAVILLIQMDSFTLLPRLYAHDQTASRQPVATIQAILRRTRPGETFILGPTHDQVEWLAYDRTIQPIPLTRQNWPSFSTLLLDENVSTILLDEETFTRRQILLADYWRLTDDGLTADILPPGWTLIEPDIFPCATCLFAFDGEVFTPLVRQEMDFAGQVKLLGYTLAPAAPLPEQPFTLTLHWQLLAPLTRTTHVFVHILDESGEIVAQSDGPLIADLQYYPDQEFPAGSYVLDDHLLSPLLPGAYAVHIGLYDWETQQRLATAVTNTNYPHLLQLKIGE